MQDSIGSDRRSLVFKKDDAPPIRWRKGRLIGCGAFGNVYMGRNLDSGELLAVKQVSIAVNNASKEKTQAHIRELEEEVRLLKNLSHPNIVRYLGTAREEESLNILLEFVPGGSISSLLEKFSSFPESVIRMYTKQLLLGLEYLHKNGIMHRDIKGANILVDNKGCIKLADFGASKKVIELATMTGAKSMKGTPYWMAPEVIVQTGHSFSADIWSVGCTVIEMATGKPPWSQQYEEVAALFHVATTKSHPPIPEHLSVEAKDFLLKCLQKEPNLRSAVSDLLEHPFITGHYKETSSLLRASLMDNYGKQMPTPDMELKNSTSYMRLKDGHSSVNCSTLYTDKFLGSGPVWKSSNREDDMCQIDNIDEIMVEASAKFSDDFNKVPRQSENESKKDETLEALVGSQRSTAINDRKDRGIYTPGWRNVVNDDRERMQKLKENEKMNEEARNPAQVERFRKTIYDYLIVATLTAAINYTAALTLPGGYYDRAGGKNQGTAILLKKASFKVFMISNAIAVASSTTSVFLLVTALVFLLVTASLCDDMDDLLSRYRKVLYLILVALVAMLLAHGVGIYMVLATFLSRAIATCYWKFDLHSHFSPGTQKGLL